jgi:uncharacterized protein (TIGR03435 family)
LIHFAFDLWALQLKGPEWLESQVFDLEAKTSVPATREEVRLMLQTLLTERFKLVTHWETKTLPGFALVEATEGHKLTPSPPDAQPWHGIRIISRSHRLMGNMTMDELARHLQGALAKPVQNHTGISGLFCVGLGYGAYHGDKQAPDTTLETDVQEQLGLRLEPRQVDFKHFVVDHAELLVAEN